MIVVDPTTMQTRLAICQGCEHYQLSTGTCGTLLIGGQVEHEGEIKSLCGCVMKLKTKFSLASCPLGKWNATVDPFKITEIKNFIKSLAGRKILSDDEANKIKWLKKEVKNDPFDPCDNCGYQQDLKELRLEIEAIEDVTPSSNDNHNPTPSEADIKETTETLPVVADDKPEKRKNNLHKRNLQGKSKGNSGV